MINNEDLLIILLCIDVRKYKKKYFLIFYNGDNLTLIDANDEGA